MNTKTRGQHNVRIENHFLDSIISKSNYDRISDIYRKYGDYTHYLQVNKTFSSSPKITQFEGTLYQLKKIDGVVYLTSMSV